MNPVIKNNFTVILLSFSYKSIVKLNGKTFGSHNMTMLYPNLCYNKACYKKTALYVLSILIGSDSSTLILVKALARHYRLVYNSTILDISLYL